MYYSKQYAVDNTICHILYSRKEKNYEKQTKKMF